MPKTSLLFKGFITFAVSSLFLAGCQNMPLAQQPSEKPDTSIQNGFTELSKVNSYQFDMNLAIDAHDPQSPLAKLAMKMGGFVDMKDINTPKISLNIDGSGNDTSGTQGSASANLQFNKDTFFFNISKFDVGTPVPPQLALIMNKWWKITVPPTALQQMHTVLDQAQKNQNTAEQEKIKKLLAENNFFSQPTFVATEDVKGESSNKYSVSIDKKMLVQFLTKYNEMKTSSALTPAEIKNLEDGLQMMNMSGFVWIGSKSHALNKVAMNIAVDNKAQNSSGNIAIDITFWDFGKDFTVEPHTDAQEFPLEQLLGPFMGGMDLGTSEPSGSTSQQAEPSIQPSSQQ